MLKNKILHVLSASLLFIGVLWAAPQQIGESNTFWEFAGGTLFISGTGNMPNFSGLGATPWQSISNNVKNIIIEDGVTSIGDYAFSASPGSGISFSLESITIPDEFNSIGSYAFVYASLKNITIPSGLESIEHDAFANIYDLESIIIPAGIKSIDTRAFYQCFSLTNVEILSDDISIGSQAFQQTSLTSLTVSASANISVGNSAFPSNILPLLTIKGNGEMKNYDNPNNFPWIGISIEKVVIEDGITSIGNMLARSGLNEIVIPNSVTNIEYNAFYSCNSLTEITFRGDKPEIGQYIFSGISALTLYYPKGNATWEGFVYDGSEYTSINLIPWGNSISFDSNGGSTVPTQTVDDGETAILPPTPVKEDHVFICWLNGETEFDFSISVTGDIILTAKWLQDLTEEYETLNRDNDELTGKITELRDSINMLNDSILVLNDSIIDLNGQIDVLKSEKEGLESELTDSTNVIRELRKELADSIIVIAELRREIEGLEADTARLYGQTEELADELSDSTAVITGLRGNIQTLQKKYDDLETTHLKALSDHELELINKQGEIYLLDEQIEDLLEQLEDCNGSKVAIGKIIRSDDQYGIRFPKNIVSDKAEINIILPNKEKVYGTTIIVYDAIGNIVFETTAKNETIIWNLQNNSGRDIANGSYLVIAEVKSGKGMIYRYSAKLGVKR